MNFENFVESRGRYKFVLKLRWHSNPNKIIVNAGLEQKSDNIKDLEVQHERIHEILMSFDV